MLTRRSERPVEFVGLNANAGAFLSVGEEVEESGCASASPSTIDPRPRSLLRALNLRRGEVVFWAENRRLTSRGRS